MKKRIIVDMLLNIIATAIPTVVLQLILLPAVASDMPDEKYGLIITILAMINVIPGTLGNSLNNIRLVFKTDQKEKVQGDYAVILLGMIVIDVIAVVAFSIIYRSEATLGSLLFTLLFSILWLCREYYIVAFRIEINYLYIVISNVILVAGYAIGFFLYKLSDIWQLIYIIGMLVCLVFVFRKSKLWREPVKTSPNFKKILFETVLLTLAGLFGRLTTYADKMFIYPLMGGTIVAVYNAATLFGKVVSMAITPISSVILSYLAQSKEKNNKTFGLTMAVSSIICVLGYVACIFISRPLLTLIYPQYVDAAMQYILITTGTVVLTTFVSIINPFVMKYYGMKWQLTISGVYVVLYVFLSMGLLYCFGLVGFCWGTFIANGVKILALLLVYYTCKPKSMG